jgi:hypothetical protein
VEENTNIDVIKEIEDNYIQSYKYEEARANVLDEILKSYPHQGNHSWIKQNTQLNSKVLELLSRIYAFYEEEGHAIMDYPFEPFHTRESIDRHVEL